MLNEHDIPQKISTTKHTGHKYSAECTPDATRVAIHMLSANSLKPSNDGLEYFLYEKAPERLNSAELEHFLLTQERFMFGYPNSLGQTCQCVSKDSQISKKDAYITWCNRFVIEVLAREGLLRPNYLGKGPNGICDMAYTSAETLIKLLSNAKEQVKHVPIVSKVDVSMLNTFDNTGHRIVLGYTPHDKRYSSHVAFYADGKVIGAGSHQSFGAIPLKDSFVIRLKDKGMIQAFVILSIEGRKRLSLSIRPQSEQIRFAADYRHIRAKIEKQNETVMEKRRPQINAEGKYSL